MDYLAIGIHEIANMSEVSLCVCVCCVCLCGVCVVCLCVCVYVAYVFRQRRTERLVNHALSGLPAFLVQAGGLNSGFMIAHCTAAALTSENKVLVHPASSDTISTSAAKVGNWALCVCVVLRLCVCIVFACVCVVSVARLQMLVCLRASICLDLQSVA